MVLVSSRAELALPIAGAALVHAPHLTLIRHLRVQTGPWLEAAPFPSRRKHQHSQQRAATSHGTKNFKN